MLNPATRVRTVVALRVAVEGIAERCGNAPVVAQLKRRLQHSLEVSVLKEVLVVAVSLRQNGHRV